MMTKQPMQVTADGTNAPCANAKRAKLIYRHHFGLPDETVERLDALAVSDGMTYTRGATLAKLVTTAARANGIKVVEAKMHRQGATVRCEPDLPHTRLKMVGKGGKCSPFPVYADLDGRAGRAFTLLLAHWKVGREDAVNRIVATGVER